MMRLTKIAKKQILYVFEAIYNFLRFLAKADTLVITVSASVKSQDSTGNSKPSRTDVVDLDNLCNCETFFHQL